MLKIFFRNKACHVTKACHVVVSDFLDVMTVKSIVIKCTNICSLLMFNSFMY